MLDFKFIKTVEENDGGVKLRRLFHASQYQGGILLRTTTIYKNSVTESVTSIPMAEIIQKLNNKLDIRMCKFDIQQVGVDLGFDFGKAEETKEEKNE